MVDEGQVPHAPSSFSLTMPPSISDTWTEAKEGGRQTEGGRPDAGWRQLMRERGSERE